MWLKPEARGTSFYRDWRLRIPTRPPGEAEKVFSRVPVGEGEGDTLGIKRREGDTLDGE